MRKQIYVLVGVVLIIAIAVLVFFFVFQRRQGPVSTLGHLQTPHASQIPEEVLITYQDKAGFEFSYPQSLKVASVSSEDKTFYSLLKITSSSQSGEVIIKVADTALTDLDAWLKSPGATGAGQSREITLAGIKGKQIQFKDPPRLVSIVIQDKILYEIQSPLDSQDITSAKPGFWNKVHNQILASFTISQENQSATSGSAGEEETTVEEEEVIE
jgi:hypothetical protein